MRVTPAGLVPVHFETLSLSNSTAVGINSTGRAYARALLLSVETNAVRMRADGTDPTLNTGILIASGSVMWLEGFNGTSALKFQRNTGSASIGVQGFTYPKEDTP